MRTYSPYEGQIRRKNFNAAKQGLKVSIKRPKLVGVMFTICDTGKVQDISSASNLKFRGFYTSKIKP